MNYELARELKDAGFMQNRHFNSRNEGLDWVNPEKVSVPTFAELVDACGDKFLVLKLNVDVKALGRWEAGSYWRQRTLQSKPLAQHPRKRSLDCGFNSNIQAR